MRVLLIIFDGLADRPAPELDGKTPLEAARTPNLDRLAAVLVAALRDVGRFDRVVMPGTALVAAEELAFRLAELPQLCMRSDRRSACGSPPAALFPWVVAANLRICSMLSVPSPRR